MGMEYFISKRGNVNLEPSTPPYVTILQHYNMGHHKKKPHLLYSYLICVYMYTAPTKLAAVITTAVNLVKFSQRDTKSWLLQEDIVSPAENVTTQSWQPDYPITHPRHVRLKRNIGLLRLTPHANAESMKNNILTYINPWSVFSGRCHVPWAIMGDIGGQTPPITQRNRPTEKSRYVTH